MKTSTSWKLCLLLLSSLFCGFWIGIGIKIAYENTAFKPYDWHYEEGPIIINCYGSDFSELQMIRAIDFWVTRGHKVAFYEHNPPEEVCENKDLEGMIILRKSKRFELTDGILAYTTRRTSFGKVKSADITYRPGSQNLQWINEHELGHALGYAHIEEAGHIMHPLYHRMDGKFWIP